ncbi:MAG TPA: lysylphosphatidylglycerol synthase domain-containing protein [Kineosporiaceae bacterium]
MSRPAAPSPSTSGSDPADPGTRRRPGWMWGLRVFASAALAVALLAVALPRVTGARWSQIAVVLGRLGPAEVGALTAAWLAGLWCYSFVLTGTVPGLTRAQAVAVNVTGSAVSNLLPFGGAAGLATTFAMLRSWGVPSATIGLSALVTGVANVVAKLALPLAGLVALLVVGDAATGRLAVAAAVAAASLAVTLGLLGGAVASERFAVALGRRAQAAATAVLALLRVRRDLRWDAGVLRWRHQVIGVVRDGWAAIALGLVGFLGAQALLLHLSLHLLGSRLGPAQVFAGYAFGRLLSTLVITPGGLGITETGVAGLLVAFGGDPSVCTSGVLLFSGFAFFAEFPAGAVGYAVWVTRRSWRRPVSHDRVPLP